MFMFAAVHAGKVQKCPVTMKNAREETETVLNVCIQHVLDRTGLKPHQVNPILGPLASCLWHADFCAS